MTTCPDKSRVNMSGCNEMWEVPRRTLITSLLFDAAQSTSIMNDLSVKKTLKSFEFLGIKKSNQLSS